MRKVTNELDSTNRAWGDGWISGVLGLFLSIAGLSTVFCFCFPTLLTVPDAWAVYVKTDALIRGLLLLVLISAFILGVISIVLRDNKTLGFCTLGITMLASLMGGSQATAKTDEVHLVYLGLDFFC